MHPDTKQDIARNLARQVLERDRTMSLDATGRSMGDTLRAGDRLIVRRAAPDALAPGDIVVVQTAAGFVAHRIIRKTGRGAGCRLWTKGDACLAADPPTPVHRVAARVVSVRRGNTTLDLRSIRGRAVARSQAVYGRLLLLLNRVFAAHHRRARTHRTRPWARRAILFPSRLLTALTPARRSRS